MNRRTRNKFIPDKIVVVPFKKYVQIIMETLDIEQLTLFFQKKSPVTINIKENINIPRKDYEYLKQKIKYEIRR